MKNPFGDKLPSQDKHGEMAFQKHQTVKYVARYCYQHNRRAYDELNLKQTLFQDYGVDDDHIKLILRQLIPEIVEEVRRLQK